MRINIKILAILLAIFPNITNACRCLEWNLDYITKDAELIFIFETDGGVTEISETKYLTGKVIEWMKGSIIEGDNVLIDYFAGTSCESAVGIKGKFLIYTGIGEHGHPIATACNVRAVEAAVYNGEIIEPTEENMKILKLLRQKTHNKALQPAADGGG